MTQAQLKHFYFPRWNACAKANDWRMVKGRLLGTRNVERGARNIVDGLYQQVWMAAEQIALQGHRAVTADDLRHGCTIVALSTRNAERGTRNAIFKSSKDFTNAECDRVVTLFRLLENPDDIAAMMDWNEPERGERKRLIYSIKKAAPEAYIRAVAEDKFPTMGDAQHWDELETWQLRQLAMTMRSRKRKWNQPRMNTDQHGYGFKQEVAESAENPF